MNVRLDKTDLTLIALVSAISIACTGVFLLPSEIQDTLKVRHAVFEPFTYVTASFVHDNLAHLFFNLLAFISFAFLLYYMNKKVEKRNFFLCSLPMIFVILPVLNYSLLFYTGFYKSFEFGYGLSLVDSALIGLTVSSITLFFRDRVKKFNSPLFFLSIVLFTLCLILLPYSSSQLHLLVFCGIFGFVVGIMEFKKIFEFVANSFRQKQRVHLMESYITVCTLFFYFFSVLGLFPSDIMLRGGITDIVSHFIGILFGISLLYPLYKLLERVHSIVMRKIRKHLTAGSEK